MVVVAGIDVGKASLDVSVAEGPVVRFNNTAVGLTRLLKHLRALDVTMAVCESTGGYERLLVDRLRKTEIAMYVAHPNRARAFARACGYEAKIDPPDAQVLSRYGQVFPVRRHRPGSWSRTARSCRICCDAAGSWWNRESGNWGASISASHPTWQSPPDAISHGLRRR